MQAAAPVPEVTIARSYWIYFGEAVVAGQPSRAAFAGNCVAMSGAGRVVEGTAAATWESSNPLQEMELFVMQGDGTVLRRASGHGAATLDLEGLQLDGRGGPQLFVGVQVPRDSLAGADYGEGTLAMEFVFDRDFGGDVPVLDRGWGCWTEP